MLLNLSTVLVLPSFIEGFGLPAVEAAACGCPVIATSASPLPTLLGDAAVFFDPNEPEALTQSLHRVISSEERQKKMRKDGLAAAVAHLAWAARQLMPLMQKG